MKKLMSSLFIVLGLVASLEASSLLYKFKVNIVEVNTGDKNISIKKLQKAKSTEEIFSTLKRYGEVKNVATKEFFGETGRTYSSSAFKEVSYTSSCIQIGDKEEQCSTSVAQDGYWLNIAVNKTKNKLNLNVDYTLKKLLSMKDSKMSKVQLPEISISKFNQEISLTETDTLAFFVSKSGMNPNNSEIVIVELKK